MAYTFGTIFSNADDTNSILPLSVSVTWASHDRAFIPITYGSGVTITETIADGTNTYTAVPTNSHVNIGSDSQTYALYECKDCAAGTFSLLFTPGIAVPFRGIAGINIAGLDNTAAAVVASQGQAGPGTGTNAVSSGSLTPGSQPGAIIVFTVDDNGNASSITASSGFADHSTIAQWDSVIGVVSRVEDQRLTSTSSISGTFTANGNGSGNFATFAVFVPEASGGGGGLPFFIQNAVMDNMQLEGMS